MGKGDRNKNFAIPNPVIQLDSIIKEQSKYRLGEKGYSFHAIRSMKPVFAFDYLSCDNTDLCFNSSKLDTKDYVGLLEGLKKISAISYNDLKIVPAYRFHVIDFNDKSVAISIKDFKKILTHKDDLLKDEEMPNLYQFDFQYQMEARVCGFLYKGIFYLVWYWKYR